MRFGCIQVCATEFSMFHRVWVWNGNAVQGEAVA